MSGLGSALLMIGFCPEFGAVSQLSWLTFSPNVHNGYLRFRFSPLFDVEKYQNLKVSNKSIERKFRNAL